MALDRPAGETARSDDRNDDAEARGYETPELVRHDDWDVVTGISFISP